MDFGAQQTKLRPNGDLHINCAGKCPNNAHAQFNCSFNRESVDIHADSRHYAGSFSGCDFCFQQMTCWGCHHHQCPGQFDRRVELQCSNRSLPAFLQLNVSSGSVSKEVNHCCPRPLSNQVIIYSWYLLRPNCDRCISEVAIGGYICPNATSSQKIETTSILERLEECVLVTKDGVLVTLVGMIDECTTVLNGFSLKIAQSFHSGFPRIWSLLLDMAPLASNTGGRLCPRSCEHCGGEMTSQVRLESAADQEKIGPYQHAMVGQEGLHSPIVAQRLDSAILGKDQEVGKGLTSVQSHEKNDFQEMDDLVKLDPLIDNVHELTSTQNDREERVKKAGAELQSSLPVASTDASELKARDNTDMEADTDCLIKDVQLDYQEDLVITGSCADNASQEDLAKEGHGKRRICNDAHKAFVTALDGDFHCVRTHSEAPLNNALKRKVRKKKVKLAHFVRLRKRKSRKHSSNIKESSIGHVSAGVGLEGSPSIVTVERMSFEVPMVSEIVPGSSGKDLSTEARKDCVKNKDLRTKNAKPLRSSGVLIEVPILLEDEVKGNGACHKSPRTEELEEKSEGKESLEVGVKRHSITENIMDLQTNSSRKKRAKALPPPLPSPVVSVSRRLVSTAFGLKTSRSGRLLVPPLAHWCGQYLVRDMDGGIIAVENGTGDTRKADTGLFNFKPPTETRARRWQQWLSATATKCFSNKGVKIRGKKLRK